MGPESTTTNLDSATYLSRLAYPLSEAACPEVGGHCYEQGNFTLGDDATMRTCKHCGKKQHGTPQQDIRWEDA